jgi:hypothetical protein
VPVARGKKEAGTFIGIWKTFDVVLTLSSQSALILILEFKTAIATRLQDQFLAKA